MKFFYLGLFVAQISGLELSMKLEIISGHQALLTINQKINTLSVVQSPDYKMIIDLNKLREENEEKCVSLLKEQEISEFLIIELKKQILFSKYKAPKRASNENDFSIHYSTHLNLQPDSISFRVRNINVDFRDSDEYKAFYIDSLTAKCNNDKIVLELILNMIEREDISERKEMDRQSSEIEHETRDQLFVIYEESGDRKNSDEISSRFLIFPNFNYDSNIPFADKLTFVSFNSQMTKILKEIEVQIDSSIPKITLNPFYVDNLEKKYDYTEFKHTKDIKGYTRRNLFDYTFAGSKLEFLEYYPKRSMSPIPINKMRLPIVTGRCRDDFYLDEVKTGIVFYPDEKGKNQYFDLIMKSSRLKIFQKYCIDVKAKLYFFQDTITLMGRNLKYDKMNININKSFKNLAGVCSMDENSIEDYRKLGDEDLLDKYECQRFGEKHFYIPKNFDFTKKAYCKIYSNYAGMTDFYEGLFEIKIEIINDWRFGCFKVI
jgi:hypothetical protein